MTQCYADQILYSKAVFTAEADQPFDGGVATKADKILAVGSRQQLQALQGPGTQVLDYGNNLIMPGFCDAHIHLLHGALEAHMAILSSAKSEAETVAMVAAHYQAHREYYKEGDWILGLNWYSQWWDDKTLPTKASLDAVFPHQPVFLQDADGHAGWVNSKALELAGINGETPQPEYGEIRLDEKGEPTGYLVEGAMGLMTPFAFQFADTKLRQLILDCLPHFNQNGITSVNDMQPFFGTDLGNPAVYQKLAEEGLLTLRINFAAALEHPLEYALKLKQAYSGSMVHYTGGKAFLDGIIPTHTAVMLAPYTDGPGEPYQYKTADYALLRRQILAYHQAGLPVHLHATGDGAVHFALDCYEEAVQTQGPSPSRLSIEHIDLADPADWPRFGKNGVVASMQPQHLALTKTFAECDYPPAVGGERSKNLWAIGSLLQNGAHLAFGTDYPIVELNPFIGVFRAVTRLFDDLQPTGGWNPQEKISLATALQAYTLGGAYKLGREQELGTLSPGKLADLIVVDGDLFHLQPEEIRNAAVAMTMVGGKIIYEK